MEDKVKAIEILENDGWIFEEDEHQMRLVKYYNNKEQRKLVEVKNVTTRKRKNV